MASASIPSSGGELIRSAPVSSTPVGAKPRNRTGLLAAGFATLALGVAGVGKMAENLGFVEKGTVSKGIATTFDSALNLLGTTTVEQQLNSVYGPGRDDNFYSDLDLVLHHRVGTIQSDWNDYFADFPEWHTVDVASWPSPYKEQFASLEPNHQKQILWINASHKKLEDLKTQKEAMIGRALEYMKRNPPRDWANQNSENRAGLVKSAMKTEADTLLPKQDWQFSVVPKRVDTTLASGLSAAQ